MIARNASWCTAFARSASACNCITIARRRVRCSGSSGAACCCAQAQNTGAITVGGGEFLRCVLPIPYPVGAGAQKFVDTLTQRALPQMLELDDCLHLFGRGVSAWLRLRSAIKGTKLAMVWPAGERKGRLGRRPSARPQLPDHADLSQARSKSANLRKAPEEYIESVIPQ